jgi:hypothetical protein
MTNSGCCDNPYFLSDFWAKGATEIQAAAGIRSNLMEYSGWINAMETKRMVLILTLVLTLAVGAASKPLMAADGSGVDHSLYGGLLKKYVRNGQVDYGGIQSEEAALDRYLDLLQSVDIKSLSTDEQFAFYTNAYNAWTIKLILTKYPDISSIKSLGIFNTGPWKKKVVRLKSQTVSLDYIEHDILRPLFKDPRVHFAINCAAKSCPPLRSEPYDGDKLDQQLDESTRAFINNPDNYRLEGQNLYISRIFKWFAEDFKDDPLRFFRKYATGEFKRNLDANSANIQIKYLDYDWSLNGE